MEIAGKTPFINGENYIKNINDQREIETSSKKASRAAGSEYQEDKVVLSSKIREIQEAKKLLSLVPDIREEKIDKIKKQIENGTYQIEGEKIAGKMISESLLNELL